MITNVKNLIEIHIEPSHTLGLSKEEPLGRTPRFEAEPMSVTEAENICDILKNRVRVPVKVSK